MLFKPLPQNIDFFLLQDHLFQTLKKNKLTQQLINLRAQQIVKSLLKDTIQSEISQKYNQACFKLQQTQKQYHLLQNKLQKTVIKEEKKKRNLIKDMKLQHEDILIKTNTQLQTKDQLIMNLEEKISQIQESLTQLQLEYQKLVQQNLQKTQEMEKLSKQNKQIIYKNEQLTRQFNEFKQKNKLEIQRMNFSHQEQINKNFSKIKNLNNSLLQAQNKIQQISTQNNTLKKILTEKDNLNSQRSQQHQIQLKKANKQVQKLKKQLQQSQQNYSILKKQISKFKDKYQQFQEEYNSIKVSHQLQLKESSSKIQVKIIKILSLENQLREVTKKNEILSTKNSIMKKVVEKLRKYLSTSIVKLRQENLTLKCFLKQNFHFIKEYSETSVMKVVNHLSSELSTYFQECVFQIKKAREQKSLAKQEVKVKTQLIEHLDKMLDSETKSVYDLKYELKQKIKEQEKLRKKLKTHYQETDKKLEEFQSKYISILRSDY